MQARESVRREVGFVFLYAMCTFHITRLYFDKICSIYVSLTRIFDFFFLGLLHSCIFFLLFSACVSFCNLICFFCKWPFYLISRTISLEQFIGTAAPPLGEKGPIYNNTILSYAQNLICFLPSLFVLHPQCPQTNDG